MQFIQKEDFDNCLCFAGTNIIPSDDTIMESDMVQHLSQTWTNDIIELDEQQYSQPMTPILATPIVMTTPSVIHDPSATTTPARTPLHKMKRKRTAGF